MRSGHSIVLIGHITTRQQPIHPAHKMYCRLLQAALVGLLSSVVVAAAPCQGQSPPPFSDFTNNVVFRPGPEYTSWGTIYGRSLQLSDGSL